ncbi:MAG: hypothetical protein WAN66_07280 [Limnoraphis robusta]|jgi:hypothetical protein|uniref:Uncharacterized protein n=1 Tax=Limnoraphis robusta CS-951 TaxID=1637645 RepID=A0A0F5YMB7_9CYAN|nr:hypothetical protein [Limnoraphis robusta]KKD39802.1 hypothetical protein WN50_01410 [Limnoraphis robusta CS-951]MCG5061643.1 hypothetical protein [Limnoraphis sp. WC205]
MEIRWKKFFIKTGIWVATEVWLNVLGLDNLADYSEFLVDQELEKELALKNHRTIKISNFPPQYCKAIQEFCPITTVKELNETSKYEDFQHRFNTFENKCKKLKNPCTKVWCLPYVRPSWLTYQRL